MTKKMRYLLGVFIGIILIVIVSLILINVLNDDNKLTVNENKWVNSNTSTVINVNVINDLDVFGNLGKGLFYDFLTDLQEEYNLKINPVTYTSKDSSVSSGFLTTNTPDDKFVTFYTDNFVLVKKEYEYISCASKVSNIKVGVLSSDLDYLKSFLGDAIEYLTYDNITSLEEAFSNDLDYILVPRFMVTSYILENNYSIVYQYSDIKKYYGYYMLDDNFSSILKKYFNKWENKNFDDTFNKHLKSTLTDSINLNEASLKELEAKTYNYGFVNNSPYEIILGGNYGGIISIYLKNFSDMAKVDFKYIKYRNYDLLTNAINNNEVDLYFNYYTLTNNYLSIATNMNIEYYVIANNEENSVINSINSLKNKDVYVLENSLLSEYLKSVGNINIHTFKKSSELKNLKNSIIFIDKDNYDYLDDKIKDKYSIRYSGSLNDNYSFKVREDNSFYKLFKAYVSIMDARSIRIKGINSYVKTLESGTLIGTIARYLLYFLLILFVITYILYRRVRKIKISKRIKKEEKIRYIDQLTSLKNRNYLMENISNWNKNTIYPQAIVVVDLNRVQEINDTLGYENGDKQIKGAANILIRTQLDNSDIIRSDGNEFVIYLVGYDERQIVSYIKKLYKEFKNLPYDFGASVGHSMIDSDKKLLEDALNEAVEDMKEKKQESNIKE